MVIPAEDNKLCYISCSKSRIAKLSALIYPILSNLGITPVRIDDMLMPSDNWIDVSQTAIRKSKAVILDVSDYSSNVLLEFGLINSIKQGQNVLTIFEEGTTLPFWIKDQPILMSYSFSVDNDKKTYSFVKALKDWCCHVFGIEMSPNNKNNSHSIFADAYRLFDKKEYSACIVSAYSSLEYQLSMQAYNSQNTFYDIKHQILNASQYLNNNHNGDDDQRAINIIELRNKIVHHKYVATKKEAADFLSSVEIIYYNNYKE